MDYIHYTVNMGKVKIYNIERTVADILSLRHCYLLLPRKYLY